MSKEGRTLELRIPSEAEETAALSGLTEIYVGIIQISMSYEICQSFKRGLLLPSGVATK